MNAPTAGRGPAPAFVHVDLDNLWAVADCYGVEVAAEIRDFVYEDALPRFLRLFREQGLQATLFVVGRDLESQANVDRLRTLTSDGHRIANHSQNHRLDFRSLKESEIEAETAEAETAIERIFGERPQGFRAPGYGVSKTLLTVLARRGYAYDCSAMPGPYGAVFRTLDRRLQATVPGGRGVAGKTQYSRLSDMIEHPLAPHRVSTAEGRLLEIPSAVSPLLRLPFQAGVCLRLGRGYFDAQLAAFRRRPRLPLLFLLHGADVTDFAALGHPFFRDSPYFSRPVEEKEAGVRHFLSRIGESYRIRLTEDWIASGDSDAWG